MRLRKWNTEGSSKSFTKKGAVRKAKERADKTKKITLVQKK